MLNSQPRIVIHIESQRVQTGQATVVKRSCVVRGKAIAQPRTPMNMPAAPKRYEIPKAAIHDSMILISCVIRRVSCRLSKSLFRRGRCG